MTSSIKKIVLFFFLYLLVTFSFSEEFKFYFPDEEIYSTLNSIYSYEYEVLDPECIYKDENNVIRILYTSNALIDSIIKIVWDTEKPYVIYSEGIKNEYDDTLEKIYYKKKYIENYEISKLQNYIEERGVFESPFSIYSNTRDGYTLIIELNINGKYKLIERDSPQSGEIYDFYKYILTLCKNLKILPSE